MTSLRTIVLFLLLVVSGCLGAGTLGGFDLIKFSTSKRVLVNAIDSLYAQHPEYRIPNKWKARDNWKSRGYDFLDTRIFYFSSSPEEMYYVSFYGDANESIQADTTTTGISIRAVNSGADAHWAKESDFSPSEKKRIDERFRSEIVSKLEAYSNSEATVGY
jgi:hypothetical protein